MDIVHTQIDLAFRVIGQIGVNNSLIQSELSSIAGDFQHIVNARFHNARMNLCRTLGQFLYHLLLDAGGLRHHIVIDRCRRWEIKLIGGLNVRGFLEQRHKLRQVEELGEAGSCAISRALGNEFVKMISLIFLNLTNRLKRNLPEPRVCIYP